MQADEIPVAHTPAGGWRGEMPPAFLDACTEPLPPGAPDMRGMWQLVSVEWKTDARLPGIERHVERIEQCGDRLIVTADGIVHDMRCDGTEERGVHDVSPRGDEVHVVATFEDGVHVLRPIGIPGLEVTRRLDGDHLVWDYGPFFVARLERIA